MATHVPLYAWVAPAFSTGSPVDHTWVTTYDNRANPYPSDQAVSAAGEFYWYCWGSFHAQGGTPQRPDGFLAQQSGDLAFARCLVAANADSRVVPAARGTIFTYGVDGVCHQLANQVLFATGVGGAAPLTCNGARGYMASTFIYGTYGLQHAAWAHKIASCGGAPRIAMAGGGATVPELPDDFEARARNVLQEQHPKLLSDLLALRADTHRFAAQQWPGVSAPSAEALNARNQHLIDEAARLLGPDKFMEIFGFSPEERIQLIDPTIQHPERGR